MLPRHTYESHTHAHTTRSLFLFKLNIPSQKYISFYLFSLSIDLSMYAYLYLTMDSWTKARKWLCAKT